MIDRRRSALALAATLALTLTLSRPTAAQDDDPLAFVYSDTIGTTGLGWERSNAYLAEPWGLGADGDGVWVANAAGRNLVRFGGGPVQELGKAGSLLDLYGAPARHPSDVVALGEVAASSTPVPTATPNNPIRPSPLELGGLQAGGKAIWFVDEGAHVAVELPIIADGISGSPRILGEPDVAGADALHFDGPSGIAIGSAGHVFVSDTGNHRVQVFDAEGVHVATIGQTGVTGQGNGRLDGPARLAIDSDDVLYVADSGNHRVQAFDVSDPAHPAYKMTYGTAGAPGNGEDDFDTPIGVAVDATFLYVADSGNGRVQLIKRSDGKYWTTLDGSSADSCGQAGAEPWRFVSDVALDDDGSVYVARPKRMLVEVCDAFDRRQRLEIGAPDVPYRPGDGLHNAPSGVAVLADGSVVVAELDGHRVLRREPGEAAEWIVGAAGLSGDGEGQFNSPTDLVQLSDGRLVVSDTGNGRLVVLGPDGSWSAVWDSSGLREPVGLSALPTGGVAVADRMAGVVRRFDATGADLGALQDPAGTDHTFSSPADVAIDADGNWYVSDQAEHVVYALDDRGTELRLLGTPGGPDDDFSSFRGPRGLAVDGAGRLYVADTGNHRIQVFDSNGTYLTSVGGALGDGTGGLLEPSAAAVGGDGRLYVADTYNHRVQVFHPAQEPWLPAATNGFGERGVAAVSALLEFDGYLYGGTFSREGASIQRRGESYSWEAVAPAGFAGAGHVGVLALAAFDGELYAGTEQLEFDTDPSSGSETISTTGGSIWRSGDGSSWEEVVSGGFGEVGLAGVGALAGFDGYLYAGTRGLATSGEGAQLWRSSTGAAGTWERVRIDLFTITEWDKVGAISALAVYSNTLVAGTCSSDGPHIWSSSDGSIWRPIGYIDEPDDPRSAVPQLGSSGTACVTSFAEHDGYLYAGVGNEDPSIDGRFYRRGGAEVWRCAKCDGTDWLPASASGFGKRGNQGELAIAGFVEHPFSYVYAAVGNTSTGVEVWRSPDGLDWEPVSEWGFGDDNNRWTYGGAIAEHRGRLHIGTANLAHGGEVWSTAGTRPGTVPTPPGPTATPTPRPSPQPPTGRARYTKVDEWPEVPAAPGDVLGEPQDMAIADDATVYIADYAPGRLLRLDPDGEWADPVGGTGSGPDRLTEPWAVAVDSSAGLVYVSDRGTERIVVHDREGEYLSAILDVHAMDIEVRPDGTLWVADLITGGVRRLAPDGTELERFGTYGPREEDQFDGLVAVTEEPGGALWIADQDGQRLRRFVRDSGTFTRVRTVDLASAQFARGSCTGERMQAVSDTLLLAGACVLEDGHLLEGLPANHRGSDLYGTGLRTVNASAGLFYGLATYDIDRYDSYNETYPTVVRYLDDGFDIVIDTWRGRWFNAETADPDAVTDPVRISALPDGSMILSDGLGLRRFTAAGNVMEILPVESVPSRSSTLELDPRLVVGTGEPGRVMGVAEYRYGRRGFFQVLLYAEGVERRVCRARICRRGTYLETIWDTTLVNLNLSRGTMDYSYAAAFEPTKRQYVLLQLWADSPSDLAMPARLYVFPVEQRGRKTEILLEGTEREVLWTDVAAGPDGRIYVLDILGDKVQVFDADGNDLGQLATVKDAWKVAGGPNGEVFVLTTYGQVVRMASDGTILSRFVGLPNDFTPHTALMDLTVDEWGRVYTIDTLYDQVTVFEPEGTEDDVIQGGKCSLAGDKWVAPEDILLGDTAQVFLSLFGSCGFQENPSDVVLVVGSDRSRNANLRVARHILALVDLDRHRAGVISYSADSIVEQPLTYSRESLIRSLLSLPYRRPGNCGINHLAALKTALDMIEDQPERRKVVILIPPGDEPEPGSCPWDIYRIALQAELLKARGAIVVAVNRESVAASSELLSDVQVAQRGQGVGRPALRRAVSREWPQNLLDTGTLVDEVPANIGYVAGSANPPAAWDPAARTLTWDLTDSALRDAHRFEITIRPQEEGLWPTNVQAVADGNDGWGNPVSAVLPVPKIRVYGEIPPTATATSTATPTPGPTRTPRPATPIYLPITLKTVPCVPGTRNADVALVIDTSGSMSSRTSPDGPTKLEAAREAARRFALQLVDGRDQAALIQFNLEATVLVGLTGDIDAVSAGLDQLTQASGTRIDLALDAARLELTGPARRLDNNPVIILLTDGEPTGATPQDVRLAAQKAKDEELLVFTIGLGQEVDGELLTDVASKPDWYFYAPDTSDLEGIYDQIVYEIPCQPMWP